MFQRVYSNTYVCIIFRKLYVFATLKVSFSKSVTVKVTRVWFTPILRNPCVVHAYYFETHCKCSHYMYLKSPHHVQFIRASSLENSKGAPTHDKDRPRTNARVRESCVRWSTSIYTPPLRQSSHQSSAVTERISDSEFFPLYIGESRGWWISHYLFI